MVQGALKEFDGIVDIKTDVSDHTCTFSAPADLDIEAMLNQIVEGGTNQVKDWSLDESK